MPKQINYRKLYEEITGAKIRFGYAIHHIDFNRENNNITNLVALPKGLHSSYHIHLHDFKEKYPFVFDLNDYHMNSNQELIDKIIKLDKVCKECYEYVKERDQLLFVKYNRAQYGT